MSRFLRRGLIGLLALGMFGLAGCAETTLAVHTAKQVGIGQSTPKSQGGYKVGEAYQINGVWYTPAEDYAYDETGVSSYYGGERQGVDFHGRYTANGEVYDQNALTAAHRTLPMPSLVRVTNLENGRQLVLRVNDRGPFLRGRIIDVSRRSAQLLGFEGVGTARVRVQIMAEESKSLKEAMLRGEPPAESPLVAAAPREQIASAALPPPAGSRASSASNSAPLPPPSATLPPGGSDGTVRGSRAEGAARPAPPVVAQTGSAATVGLATTEIAALPVSQQIGATPTLTQVPIKPSKLYVQAGAFSNYDNAFRLGTRLARFGKTQVQPVRVGALELFRVRVGPVQSVQEADRLLDQVAGVVPEARVVVD